MKRIEFWHYGISCCYLDKYITCQKIIISDSWVRQAEILSSSALSFILYYRVISFQMNFFHINFFHEEIPSFSLQNGRQTAIVTDQNCVSIQVAQLVWCKTRLITDLVFILVKCRPSTLKIWSPITFFIVKIFKYAKYIQIVRSKEYHKALTLIK